MSLVPISVSNIGYQEYVFRYFPQNVEGSRCQGSKYKVVWYKDVLESAGIAPRTFLALALDEGECDLVALPTLNVGKGTPQRHPHA
jgi:hypothetical protein